MRTSSTYRRPKASLLLGLALVTLGILLLLTTTGVVSYGIWLELVDYWPVLLVLAGVEIILAQRAMLARAVIIVMTITGVVIAAYLSIPVYDPVEPLHSSYVETLDDNGRLRLSMEYMGGSVELKPARQGTAAPGSVLSADFGSRPAHVIREWSNDDVRILLVSSGPLLTRSSDDGRTRHKSRVGFPVGLADWNLQVSPDVEVDIEIASGATDLDLDLRDLKVRRLDIEAGTSGIRVQLPRNAGMTHVDIAGVVTDVELVVPQDVAAHIDISAPIRALSIDLHRFVHMDDVYQSPDYLDAHNRVSIDVEALAADVTVH